LQAERFGSSGHFEGRGLRESREICFTSSMQAKSRFLASLGMTIPAFQLIVNPDTRCNWLAGRT
jgi:hypothetical protein